MVRILPLDPEANTVALAGISRRALLRRGAALGMVGVIPGALAACGGGGGTSGASATSSSTPSTSTAANGQVGGGVGYLGLKGEDFPSVLKAFYTQHGIKVEPTYVNSGAETIAKYMNSPSGTYDVIANNVAEIPEFEQAIDFLPIDVEQIPNWNKIERYLSVVGEEHFANPEGQVVLAPLSWGALGLTYNAKVVKKPTSWEQLLEPEFKKKVVIIDDPNPNFALAFRILGIDSTKVKPEQLKEARDYLKEVVANCITVSSSYGDLTNLLVSEEATAMFAGWSAIGAFAAEAGNSHIVTNIYPKEGTVAFSEGYLIPSNSNNVASVYAMTNELLSPTTNSQAATSIFCSAVSDGATKLQPNAVATYYPKESDLEKFFSNSSLAVVPPPEPEAGYISHAEMVEAWTEVKTGA